MRRVLRVISHGGDSIAGAGIKNERRLVKRARFACRNPARPVRAVVSATTRQQS